MNLVSLDIESIQLGHPLPFVLRGSDGVLLAQKGYVIRTREELADLAVDEIMDIEGMTEERAAIIIMAARAPMFVNEDVGNA